MSGDAPIIASAVVIPANATQPSPPPRKRRESADQTAFDDAQPSKRTRLGGASNQDERKRNQRLFGSILGNLGRVSQDNRTKKRLEVEAKMQEKMRVQHEEDKADLKRSREVKDEERKIFAGHAAQVRRRNESHMANFLATKSKPKIYYRPWKLLRSQEIVIEKQKEMAAKNRSPSPEFDGAGPSVYDEGTESIPATDSRDRRDDETKKDNITMHDDSNAPEEEEESRQDGKGVEVKQRDSSPIPNVSPGDEEEEMVEY